MTCPRIEGARDSHPRKAMHPISCRDSRHEEIPGNGPVFVQRRHTLNLGIPRRGYSGVGLLVPLPRHAFGGRPVPGVWVASTFDPRARHPRLTSYCRGSGCPATGHLDMSNLQSGPGSRAPEVRGQIAGGERAGSCSRTHRTDALSKPAPAGAAETQHHARRDTTKQRHHAAAATCRGGDSGVRIPVGARA